MPQARQRIVFCDCLDCVQQPSTTDVSSSTSPANEAAAKQEPPPKCLMFVLSGVLLPRADTQEPGSATVLDSCNFPHLNRATAQGNLSLLTLRQAAAADSCTELAQVFCIHQELQEGSKPMTVTDRFKGMAASFSSNSTAAQELATAAGMNISNILNVPSSQTDTGDAAGMEAGGLNPLLTGTTRGRHTVAAAAAATATEVPASNVETGAEAGGIDIDGASGATAAAAAAAADVVSCSLPDPAEAARRILQELELQNAAAGLDMLTVHLDLHTLLGKGKQQQQQQEAAGISKPVTSTTPAAAATAAAAAAMLRWLDKTLRYLNNSSAFKDAVLLTVLATPASSQQPVDIPMLAAMGGTAISPMTPPADKQSSGVHQQLQHQQQQQQQQRRVLRPMQSCEQLAGQPLAVSKQRAVLCLRRLPGVIRRDSCNRFSLKDCCSSSGSLALLADRLLPEVAYKLGRAPKYGA